MADYLVSAALFVLVVTVIGLFRLLGTAGAAMRMMAVQLLGTGGAAALLLLGTATGAPALNDVALLLTLFAAFGCAAFVLGEPRDASAHAPSREQA